MRQVVLFLIRAYQRTLSRVLPSVCRFEPPCSEYSYEAIAKYGLLRGGRLALRRIARCQPLAPGGYDPVP